MEFVFKKESLGIVPFALFILLVAVKIALSYYTFGVSAELTRWLFVTSAAVSALCIYFASKSYGCFKLYSAIILSLFLANCCIDLVFSPVDECAHFEFIEHILGTGTLPVIGDPWSASAINSVNYGEVCPGFNHEAAQAPVYYLFLAAFGSFIGNNALSLIIYRIIGLALTLLTVVICSRLARVLFGHSLSDSPMFRLLILLTIFSPGYLYRAARLNNEIMVCFLFVVLLYEFFLTFIDNRTYRYWLVSLMAVLLFLTKSTAIYSMVLPILLFVLHLRDSRKKTVLVSLAVFSLLTLPWFGFNLTNYHALTGLKKHLDYVLPIVNPQHLGIDFIQAFFDMLPLVFYSAEEFVFHSVTVHFISCGYILILIIFFALSCKSVLAILNIRQTLHQSPNAARPVWEQFAVGLTCLAVAMLLFHCFKYIVSDIYPTTDKTFVVITVCLALVSVFSICVYRVSLVVFLGCKFSFGCLEPFDRKNLRIIVNISCIAVILAAVAVLVCGSITSAVCAVRGRYLYPVAPALCLLLINNRNLFSINIKRPLKLIAVLMLALVVADTIPVLITKSMSYRGFLAAGVYEVHSSDLTDGNWIKGTSRDGKMILLDYSPYADYSLMRGRVFLNRGEYAYVDREENAGKYERLYLKNRVNPQKVSDSAWINVDKYSLKMYNIWGGQTVVGKVNGTRLSQSFKIKADSLIGFSVMIATYNQPSLSLDASYKLIDCATGKTVTEGLRHFDGVRDSQWAEILFSSPVTVLKNGRYRLELILDNPEGKALNVYATQDDSYADGELDAEIPGADSGLDLKFGLIQN
jgi:hypothetical protein